MAKTKKELRDDKQPRPDKPKNISRRVKPAPETTKKVLAVRKLIAAEESRPRTMKEVRKHNEATAKKLRRDKLKTHMLRRGKDNKDAMKMLEDTFRFLRQRMPVMRTTMDDPTPAFLIDVYDNVAKWPERVMREFLRDLTEKEPPPDVPGMIGEVKRLIHEVFDDTGLHTGQPYLARWRMWPYRKDSVDQSEPKPSDDGKENMMASKMATKKKVQSVKRGGTPETETTEAKKGKTITKDKPAKTGGRRVLGEDTTLKPGKNMPTRGIYGQLLPLIPKAGITLAALCKAAIKIKFPESKTRRYAAGAVREGYALAE